jgi:hypothetical protein
MGIAEYAANSQQIVGQEEGIEVHVDAEVVSIRLPDSLGRGEPQSLALIDGPGKPRARFYLKSGESIVLKSRTHCEPHGVIKTDLILEEQTI